MLCWHCNSEVIWENEYAAEDYGYDDFEEGTITVMTCSNKNCVAKYEITRAVEGENND